MRFMTLGKVGQDSEAGSLPSQELLEAMDWPEGPQDRGYPRLSAIPRRSRAR